MPLPQHHREGIANLGAGDPWEASRRGPGAVGSLHELAQGRPLNFYELDGGGGHVYRRVKNLRRDGQLISANADCFHSIDVAVGPTIVDSALGYCLDDFFNIHNSIHVLLPPAPTALTSYASPSSPSSPSSPPPPPPSSNTISATLVNPRISVVVSDSAENVSTLDQTYGTTSPMSNIQVRTCAWRHAAATSRA